MPQPKSKSHYAFDRLGNYRIRVEGFLDKDWSEKPRQMNGMTDRSQVHDGRPLGDLSISTAGRGDQKSVTVLADMVRARSVRTFRGADHPLRAASDAFVSGLSGRVGVQRFRGFILVLDCFWDTYLRKKRQLRQA